MTYGKSHLGDLGNMGELRSVPSEYTESRLISSLPGTRRRVERRSVPRKHPRIRPRIDRGTSETPRGRPCSKDSHPFPSLDIGEHVSKKTGPTPIDGDSPTLPGLLRDPQGRALLPVRRRTFCPMRPLAVPVRHPAGHDCCDETADLKSRKTTLDDLKNDKKN
jgi:hypothetical protein